MATPRFPSVDASGKLREQHLPDHVQRSVVAERVGDVFGGQVLAPIRVPHLVVDDVYPKPMQDLLVLWAEPSGVMYGSDRSGALWKSTNHGQSWSLRGTQAAQIAHPQAFLRLKSGTLLAFDQALRVIRSTDDGATWHVTHSSRPGTTPMGPTSWCEDQHGHIYYGEYQVSDAFTAIHVYRSTDDGQSFSVFHAFPGPATTDPARVRHIHSVTWDPVSQRVYVATGDPEPKTGIYRTNAAGGATTLEPVITNDQLLYLGSQQARAIGIMYFPDSIVWGVDGTAGPNIIRLPRSEIGKPNPQAEIIYRVNATAWFATRLSKDGTVWLLSVSREGATAIDRATHLYVVEDEGRRVWEVGSYPQASGSSNGGLAPVGQPHIHDDRAWLATYNLFAESGEKQYNAIAVRMARGTQQLSLAPPPRTMMPPVVAWQTDGARVSLDANDATMQTYAFGASRCSVTRRILLIHDWTLRRLAAETSGTATIQLVNVATGQVLWTSANTGTEGSRRSSQRLMDAGYIESIDMGTNVSIEWRVTTTNTFKGFVKVVYGWANVPVGVA